MQSQYESHQDSEDQIQQGGVLLNQDRFLVRRGRLRLDAGWRYVELGLELDGSTTRGPIFGARRAEASLLLRQSDWNGEPRPRGVRQEGGVPLAMITFGLSEIPFGFELVDSARERVFMERSVASLAFFPGEPDVGARLSGGLGFFRYALAVLNGEPVDDRPSRPARDPNAAKDVVARLGIDTRATPGFRVSGGVSALHGTGFHPGQEATKGTLQWRDLNENSAVDPGEVTALPGSAATPSQNFTRWAVGLDLQLRLRTPLGEAMLYGEAGVAQNLDRGLYPADPITAGVDVRHFFYYGAFVQEITRFGIAGFRVDHYNPNADFLDPRGGKLVPTAQGITTLSPVAGLVLPNRARLLFQYDAILDALARDARGVPTDLKNDRWTLRLQVEL
ncbi:uncharacterized protein CMC5_042500 [Chondromyces crocatus]|uniref:Porin n=1 Tax=Chondromyces crocatus TaxID=52 RepID=A0A0K1EHF4_CHOCO|nr:uncharacterized protein CMC5_042500 [Chondromyces crocatus]